MAKFPVRLDAARIIDDLGGVSGVHDALLTVGCDIREKTVQKWRERNNLPLHAVTAILLYSMRGGEPFPIHTYLQEQT